MATVIGRICLDGAVGDPCAVRVAPADESGLPTVGETLNLTINTYTAGGSNLGTITPSYVVQQGDNIQDAIEGLAEAVMAEDSGIKAWPDMYGIPKLGGGPQVKGDRGWIRIAVRRLHLPFATIRVTGSSVTPPPP